MQRLKNLLFLAIKGTIIFLLGYYVLKDLEFSLFLQELSNYSVFSLMLLVAVLLATDITMSMRWKLLSGDRIKSSLEAVMVAATMNILLPARLGEVAKAGYLKRYYGKSLNLSLSLIIFERFFDVLFLATGALYVLFVLVDNPVYRPVFIGIVLFQLALLFAMKYYNRPIFAVARVIPVRFLRVYAKKIILTIARKINSMALVYTLVSTTVIWLMNFLVTYVFFTFATSFDLTMIEVFVVFIITGVGFAIPLLPAGALTFQASYVFALGLYGISQSEALAASLVFHVVYIVTMLIPGKLILLFKTRPKALHE